MSTILNPRRIVLCLLLVLSLFTVRWSAQVLETAKNWGIPVGRALQVELLGRLGNTNPIPAIANGSLRGRPIPLTANGSPENDEKVRITITGSHRIAFNDPAHFGSSTYGPAAVLFYSIEVEEDGRWNHLSYQRHGKDLKLSSLTYAGSKSPPAYRLYSMGMGPGVLEWMPGESLEFPARVPLGTNRFRVRVVYYELPTQNKLTRIIDRAFALVGKKINRQAKGFTAQSEPHTRSSQ